MSRPKQVIVIRDDLRNTKNQKLRKGKIVSQCLHCSLGVILDMMTSKETESGNTLTLDVKKDSALDTWINDQFTKITLKCKSEEELLSLYDKAKDAGLPVKLITDSGFTEFGGVATNTAICIGPDYPENIDHITSHLSLL